MMPMPARRLGSNPVDEWYELMPKTERHLENLRDVLMNVACEFWASGTQLPQQRYSHLMDLQQRAQALLHDCQLPRQRDDLPSLEEVQVFWSEVVQKVLRLDQTTGMLLLESEPVALYLDCSTLGPGPDYALGDCS